MLSRSRQEFLSQTRLWASWSSVLADELCEAYALGARLLKAVREDPYLCRFSVALLGFEVVLIFGNMLALAIWLSPKLQNILNIDLSVFLTPILSVNADQGLSEILVYASTAATAGLLFMCSRRHNQPVYLSGAVAFSIMLADDSLMIHENAGGYLAASLELPTAFGLRPQDFGELIVYACYLAVFVVLGTYGLRRSERRHVAAAILFICVIGFVGIFAVIVDLAEMTIYDQYRRVALMMGVVEDSGEIVGATIGLVAALALSRHPELIAPRPDSRHLTGDAASDPVSPPVEGELEIGPGSGLGGP